MDLSKAYDCIPHGLLIVKSECYGIDQTSLRLILDYLTYRKQRTKIGSAFISWYNIGTGIPPGSILGPLLFDIFINDLFFSITKADVCNFADDNTAYSRSKNLQNVFSHIKWDLKSVLEWFRINSLKGNLTKLQLMVLGTDKVNSYNLFIDGVKVSCSKEVKLLGITIEIRNISKTSVRRPPINFMFLEG